MKHSSFSTELIQRFIKQREGLISKPSYGKSGNFVTRHPRLEEQIHLPGLRVLLLLEELPFVAEVPKLEQRVLVPEQEQELVPVLGSERAPQTPVLERELGIPVLEPGPLVEEMVSTAAVDSVAGTVALAPVAVPVPVPKEEEDWGSSSYLVAVLLVAAAAVADVVQRNASHRIVEFLRRHASYHLGFSAPPAVPIRHRHR